jgi:hypothetical protein
LANKSSKPADEPEAILDQAAAIDSQSSAVASSTPISLDTDVEMAPVVALPVGELNEGQIYHLVDGRLVIYDQAHLSPDQPSSSTPPEVLPTSVEQPITYAEIAGKELPAGPASTRLEEKLAKLSTSSSGASQGQAVSGNCKETGSQLAAGMPRVIPGLVLEPPKATPAEKRKRKRLAAKAVRWVLSDVVLSDYTFVRPNVDRQYWLSDKNQGANVDISTYKHKLTNGY